MALSEDKKYIIVGGGGHAAVIADLLTQQGKCILGATDPKLEKDTKIYPNVKIMGSDDVIHTYSAKDVYLANGLGMVPEVSLNARSKVFTQFSEAGYFFPTLVHPMASYIAENVELAEGAQVLAGAIVGPNAKIGKNTIINTGVIVEHHCNIGAHVHIATAAKLCGQVTIEDHCFIGAGSLVRQGVTISSNQVVAMGKVIKHDVR